MATRQQSPQPAISVIIPTRDRSERLKKCLAALVEQSLPKDMFEVIVIDDGSREPPRDVVTAYAGSLRIQLIEQANTGPAGARNKGAEQAQGHLLAFIDDDCEADRMWLSELHDESRRHGNCALGGHTVNALIDNSYSAASQLLVDYLYDCSFARQDSGALPKFFTSNNLAIPADGFHRIGGFAKGFPLAAGEDRELCDRWQRQGADIAYVPRAVVRHSHAMSLRSFWRQHFSYGRGAVHFRRARLGEGASAVKFARAGFYLRLVSYPLSRRPRPRKSLLLGALLLVSQVANILGFLYEARLGGQVGRDRGLRKQLPYS